MLLWSKFSQVLPCVLVSVLSFHSVAQADGEFLRKVQEYQAQSDLKAALKILSDEQLKDKSEAEKNLGLYNRALIYKKLGDDEKAFQDFQKVADGNSSLKEYGLFYLGELNFKKKDFEAARKSFKDLLKLNPNQKMQFEVNAYLAKIALENRNPKEARQLLKSLEKRVRQNETYPDVVFDLAVASKMLGDKKGKCVWLKKLYIKHPAFSKINHWTMDLASNEFLGEPTDCYASVSDFKSRIRYMIFAGRDKEAQAEINVMKERLAPTDRFQGDQIQAQFYALEGEVGKAFDVLKPWYESKAGNFNFLIQYANTAARAGESQKAVENYYKAYKISPRSKLGKQALFQSAFLSYMFQDYDGASQRFKEYQKVFKGSALNQDIRWNLAWIKYLKGDYSGAYSDLKDIDNAKRKSKKAWKKVPQDRLQYWMAMSQFRLGNKAKAKALFRPLINDPLYGFYSLSAQARVQQIGVIEPVKITVSDKRIQVRIFDRFSASDFLTPSMNGEYVVDDEAFAGEDDLNIATGAVEDESAEESENGEDNASEVADSGSDEADEAKDDGKEDSEKDDSEKIVSFSNPVLMKRFERARDLMIVGQNEWARWDLFEIERKTSNREYLSTLMGEYANIGNYYRSSYIGQTTFGRQRAQLGIEGVRYIWEHTYPRAFSEFVEKSSKNFKVPEELIWGIMRAESQYRQDVISPVGALGLMQVMPFTGYKVAQLINDKNFSPQKLLEPETAITIGSRYLRRLMDKFDGVLPLTAAAYNAGPHRVKAWLHSFGHRDTDEFIEHIPFIETRNYVKKVMSNAYVYSLLYGDKKNLYPYLAGPMPVKPVKEMVTKESWDDI